MTVGQCSGAFMAGVVPDHMGPDQGFSYPKDFLTSSRVLFGRMLLLDQEGPNLGKELVLGWIENPST